MPTTSVPWNREIATTEIIKHLDDLQKVSDRVRRRQNEESQTNVESVPRQILALGDALKDVRDLQGSIQQLQLLINDLESQTETEYTDLCEIYHSPLLAMADPISYSVLSFLDEEMLLICERISSKWRGVIQSYSLWQDLAERRNKKEETYNEITYTAERCRDVARKLQLARALVTSSRQLPSGERIVRNQDHSQDLFVRLYWRKNNRDIWYGLTKAEIFNDNINNYSSGNDVDEGGDNELGVGMRLGYDHAASYMDWKELSVYQSWLQERGGQDGSDEEHIMLQRTFNDLDFSITVLLGDEAILVSSGLKHIEYKVVEEYNSVVLSTLNDLDAKVAVMEDAVYLEIYKERSSSR